MTTWMIEIVEPHSGELGEAVLHEDHGFAFEEYTYPAGHRMEVAVHDIHDAHWHIFTDLEAGHRIKIPPEKYRLVAVLEPPVVAANLAVDPVSAVMPPPALA